MNNQEIIERAARIVRDKLDQMAECDAEYMEIYRTDLINISSALAIASVLLNLKY